MTIRKTLAAVILSLCFLTMPVYGLEPLEVTTVTEGGEDLLLQTYDADPQASVKKTITHEGEEYDFVEIQKEELTGNTQSRQETRSVDIASSSDKEDDIRKLVKESLEYSEDGFEGTLLLDKDSIQVKDASSEYDFPVEEIRVFEGLPRNDPVHIPKTVVKEGVTLQIAAIQWDPADPASGATEYTATVRYTGFTTKRAGDGYLVTASYTGTVEKAAEKRTLYTAVYRKQRVESEPEPEESSVSEQEPEPEPESAPPDTASKEESAPIEEPPEESLQEQPEETPAESTEKSGIPFPVFLGVGLILVVLLFFLVVFSIIRKIKGKRGGDEERDHHTEGRSRRRTPEHMEYMRRDSDPDE